MRILGAIAIMGGGSLCTSTDNETNFWRLAAKVKSREGHTSLTLDTYA